MCTRRRPTHHRDAFYLNSMHWTSGHGSAVDGATSEGDSNATPNNRSFSPRIRWLAPLLAQSPLLPARALKPRTSLCVRELQQRTEKHHPHVRIRAGVVLNIQKRIIPHHNTTPVSLLLRWSARRSPRATAQPPTLGIQAMSAVTSADIPLLAACAILHSSA